MLKGKTRLVADPSIGVGDLLSCVETYVEKFGVGDFASSQHWVENLPPAGVVGNPKPTLEGIPEGGPQWSFTVQET